MRLVARITFYKRILTVVRLGLSHLHKHKFRSIEAQTTAHYFLHLHFYNTNRAFTEKKLSCFINFSSIVNEVIRVILSLFLRKDFTSKKNNKKCKKNKKQKKNKKRKKNKKQKKNKKCKENKKRKKSNKRFSSS